MFLVGHDFVELIHRAVLRYAMALKRKAVNFGLVMSWEGGDFMGVMRKVCVLLVLVPVLLFGQGEVSSTQAGRIRFEGGDSGLRGVMVREAEALTKALERLLGEMDGASLPITVTLYPAEAGKRSVVAREFQFLPTNQPRFLFQVNLRLGPGNSVDQEALDRALLEMLILERSLRNLPPGEVVDRVELPPWVLDGVAEALKWQEGKGERRIYSSLMETGGWIDVEELVEARKTGEMDTLSRGLFRASSGGLAMALLANTDGKGAMSRYLQRVPTFEGDALSLLRQFFPQVNLGPKGLERWWMLQVAAMSKAPLSEAMTVPETEAALEKALRLHFKGKEGRPVVKGLSAYGEVLALEEVENRVAVVRPAADLLQYLSYRCYPAYREVIAGYLNFFDELAAGKGEEAEVILRNLGRFRVAEVARYEKLTDLLDWHHISNAREESGAFRDYLQIKRALEDAPLLKTDPFQRYVDQVQKVFDRPVRRR